MHSKILPFNFEAIKRQLAANNLRFVLFIKPLMKLKFNYLKFFLYYV